MSSSTRVYDRAVVNVRVRTREDVGEDCGVCLAPFCEDDACYKTCVQTTCCLQGMCAGFAAKLVTRCTCTDECRQIVFPCPFCRSIARITAFDAFIGTKRACKACKAVEAADAATVPAVPAVPLSPVAE